MWINFNDLIRIQMIELDLNLRKRFLVMFSVQQIDLTENKSVIYVSMEI